MISKSEIKFLKSLNILKFRNKHNIFKVEGWKSLKEFLKSDYKLVSIFSTRDFVNDNHFFSDSTKIISKKELKSVSSLKAPNDIIGVFEKKESTFHCIKSGITLFLEDVANPGNLGAIIRTADWFGIKNIICSNKSVDLYNPKVVQASMGSLCRVSVSYVDIESFIIQLRTNNIYSLAADLDGEEIYNVKKTLNVVICFGNESRGVSKKIKSAVSKTIKIPNYNTDCESLNLSISSGIIISEFLRKKM